MLLDVSKHPDIHCSCLSTAALTWYQGHFVHAPLPNPGQQLALFLQSDSTFPAPDQRGESGTSASVWGHHAGELCLVILLWC